MMASVRPLLTKQATLQVDFASSLRDYHPYRELTIIDHIIRRLVEQYECNNWDKIFKRFHVKFDETNCYRVTYVHSYHHDGVDLHITFHYLETHNIAHSGIVTISWTELGIEFE